MNVMDVAIPREVAPTGGPKRRETSKRDEPHTFTEDDLKVGLMAGAFFGGGIGALGAGAVATGTWLLQRARGANPRVDILGRMGGGVVTGVVLGALGLTGAMAFSEALKV